MKQADKTQQAGIPEITDLDPLGMIWEIVRAKTDHLWGETAPDHLAFEVYAATLMARREACGIEGQ